MNADLLHKLAALVEEIVIAGLPVAEKLAEQDPRVQAIAAASLLFLSAARDLKEAINAPPQAAPSNGPNT